MTEIELLSPAKDAECGMAAISSGADAVYIGAPKFGARKDAANSLQDIERLCSYAHKYYSRLYITLNTILYQNELREAEQLINDLYTAGADALIIQDMGILEMSIPPIPLFASTQTDNRTPEKVLFLQKAGFKRAILARELSLEEIEEIHQKTDIELESFIHGALCVSYSGRCYLSHKLSGRSANRGQCAQPCRMKYDLVDSFDKTLVKGRYLLSNKDLCLSSYIKEMISSGISSFKIEGRLKDSSYVKNITAFYRKKIDQVLNESPQLKKSSSGQVRLGFEPDPFKTFNRGFTGYFIEGRKEKVSSFYSPKSIGEPIGKVRQSSGKVLTINFLRNSINISAGDGLCFLNQKKELEGLGVNSADGNKLLLSRGIQIKQGTDIFRNSDVWFERLLKGNFASRRVNVEISLVSKDCGFYLDAKDEDGNKCSISIGNFSEESKNPAENAIRKALSAETGLFIVNSVRIPSCPLPFMRPAILKEKRRQLLILLEKERLGNYKRVEPGSKEGNFRYPDGEILDYSANVSNSLSEKFYRRHGITSIASAVEITKPGIAEEIELMRTKHCIKYQLGICKRYNGSLSGTKVQEPLYLVAPAKKLRLRFNCDCCSMSILDSLK